MVSTVILLLGPFLLGYLLGSIPFGLVLTRAAGLGDIRKVVQAACQGDISDQDVVDEGKKKLDLRRAEVRWAIEALQEFLVRLDAAGPEAP